MLTLISIFIGIVFLFLLGKAILETIWGSFLIIYGGFCQIVAHLLYALAYVLRVLDTLITASNKQTAANYCKMWVARITLTALAITSFGSVTFITYHAFCFFSEIDWQAYSDWIHATKAILNKAILNKAIGN